MYNFYYRCGVGNPDLIFWLKNVSNLHKYVLVVIFILLLSLCWEGQRQTNNNAGINSERDNKN